MERFTTLSNKDSSIIFKWDDEFKEMTVHSKFIVLNNEYPLEYIMKGVQGMYDMYEKCKLLKQFFYRTLTDVDVIFENKINDVGELRYLIYFIDKGYIELYEMAKEKWKVYLF